MENLNKNVIPNQSHEREQQTLADLMGLTLEEYKAIKCKATTDLDGSTKVYWASDADRGIVAKIKGKQSVDDDHVDLSQDMSQLGDSY